MVNQGLQLAGYLLGLMSGMVAKIICVGIINYFVIIIMSHHFLGSTFSLHNSSMWHIDNMRDARMEKV